MATARKSFSISGVLLFLLSLAYLAAELIFNHQLLDVSSSVRSNPQEVEHIQHFGRAASGCGFALLVLGLFQSCHFRLTTKKHWHAFVAISFVCFLPFILTFGQTLITTIAGSAWADDIPFTEEIAWGFIPFIGFYLVIVSKGTRPFLTALGLVVLSWPAMFYGQKLAVEKFIISPTTAQDRLNAHYILLLRAGVEDCIIALEDTAFCEKEGEEKNVEKRSTRAVLGALFMLNSQAVFNSLSFVREQIIQSIAARDLWFSSGNYYQSYLSQVAEKRKEYTRYLDENYYEPYKEASKTYMNSTYKIRSFSRMIPWPAKVEIEKKADETARQVDTEVEKGWQKYQQAVEQYNNRVYEVFSQAAGIVTPGIRAYKTICDNDNDECITAAQKISRMLHTARYTRNLTAEAERQLKEGERNFVEKSGYPPDLADKEAFVHHPATQAQVRGNVEKKLQKDIPGYALPRDWKYDPLTFKNFMQQLLLDQVVAAQHATTGRLQALQAGVDQKWRENVQAPFKTDIPPGLDREQFFKYIGIDPSPPLEDLVMPQKDFVQKYIVPMNRAAADKALEQIRQEAPDYANKKQLAQQGKDYVRVLYIPSIALCLSLFIVVLTVGRYTVKLAAVVVARQARQWPQKHVKAASWGAFLVIVLLLPYTWPNPYTESAAYRKYYTFARASAPLTTQFLDWVVHMQPLVYRLSGG